MRTLIQSRFAVALALNTPEKGSFLILGGWLQKEETGAERVADSGWGGVHTAGEECIQQAAFRCAVLPGAGEEGAPCGPVRKFLFRFGRRLAKLTKNWRLCPQSAQLDALKWHLRRGNRRPPASRWGSMLLFCCCFSFEEAWVLFFIFPANAE